ncbi:MAG: Ig-like domain-containing protein [Mediterraneibacter sp.]
MSEYGVETGPMVYIANLWDSAADNSEVRVFSNCDEVALYYNDELVAVQGHDETMWGPHGDTSESGSPGSGAGKEISTENLEYPPVTFDLSAYTAGEGTLRAVGLIDGEEAAEYVRKAPGEAASVQLRPQDDSALKLDGSDARLVWIDIADADGTVVTDAYTDVDLSITGPGLIVGPKTVQTRGGQLAVWVKSKRGEGEITLTAPEPVKVEAGTAPEDMELPENVLVTLEDGAQAAVPVEWDLTSLSVEGNTGTMTGTARAIQGIIMEDTETTLTIQYTESAQPVRIQLLQAAYDLVKDADLTDMVESIVELYNERISAAEALLARAEAGDPALTQEEVDQSVEDLIEIVQYLSFTGNKDELEKVITAAQEMEAELDKYLEKGQAEFLAALETAENVMADGDALQKEINDVMLQLVKGMADLRLRPDKSLLEGLLKEANGKNKESYTEESYQNLLSAISVADAAYSNLEADQKEVDGAAELLRAAIDSLEPAGSPDPENPDPETPGTGTSDPEPESPVSDPEDSNTGKPEGNSSDAGTQSSSLDGKKTASASGNASDAGNGNAQSAAKAVRTGDNAHPTIYAAVLLALAAGAGYTVCGRRKKK